METDKERKYQEEIERLKSFLVQLDEQIGEETLTSSRKIEMLEAALSSREEQIDELQSRIDLDHETALKQVEEENRQLKELLSFQEASLHKIQAERDNLTSALDMMQASKQISICSFVNFGSVDVQEEINMQLLTTQQRNRLLEEQLAKLQRELKEVCEEPKSPFEPGQGYDDPLANKLYRDLEMQNHLIDQLNDESIPRDADGLSNRLQL